MCQECVEFRLGVPGLCRGEPGIGAGKRCKWLIHKPLEPPSENPRVGGSIPPLAIPWQYHPRPTAPRYPPVRRGALKYLSYKLNSAYLSFKCFILKDLTADPSGGNSRHLGDLGATPVPEFEAPAGGNFMSMTHVQIVNAKARDKAYRMFDGRGLYVEISPSGGRWWRFKYRESQHLAPAIRCA